MVVGVRLMDPQVLIRAATDADLPAIAEFARQTFQHAFGADMGASALEAHLSQHMTDAAFSAWLREDQFFLAESGAELIGFVQVGRVNPRYGEYLASFVAEAMEIKRLYVWPSEQGAGVGSALLTRGLLQAEADGVIYLTTWETNAGAQRLYRRYGFTKVCEMPEYDEHGELNGYEHILVRS